MSQPLLSISIPTWNRASILDKALSQLLPQINLFKNEIELIVSDNCSTDNTDIIIKKHKGDFNRVNFTHFIQQENTGYYGNFKKCKELANGKYFWLLSDNEFVNDGVVEIVIKLLNEYNEINSIHLANWANYSNKFVFRNQQFTSEIINNDELIKKAGYKLTLISSVIFKNDKTSNQAIFNNFKGNSFLGFALFLNSLKAGQYSVIINGISLISYPTQISFNVFHSFTVDMKQCKDYALKNNSLNDETEKALMNSIIYNLTRNHYISYKINGSVYGKTPGTLDDINKQLFLFFNKYKGYETWLLPLIEKPKIYIIIEYHLERIKRKLNTLFSKSVSNKVVG